MKKTLALLAGLAFLGCGGEGEGDSTSSAAVSTALESDFTPPTGAGSGPTSDPGPWKMRLLVATSSDGLTFTRKNQLITDQGDVPDMAIDSKGWIYLYYMGWTVDTETNKPVVAISTDSGATWAYKKVVLTGFDGMSQPCDPDIQLLANGTFRLYLTSAATGASPGTNVAEGSDGIHFARVGTAFSYSGRNVLDPSTFYANGTWHLYAGGQTTAPGANWHATSSDGRTFTYLEERTFTYEKSACAVANCIPVSGGWRFYAFTHGAASIVSFFTTDGWQWMQDSGTRLVVDSTTGLEKNGVKDPAVVRLADGTYLMVYVTEIP